MIKAGSGMLVRSALLAARNPIVFVPGIVIGLAGAIVTGFLDPIAASLAGDVTIRFFISLTNVVVTVLSVAAATGLANAAWKTGAAALPDARQAFENRALPAVLTVLGASVVAALLEPLTLGLSYFADMFFLLYALPAAVAGERTPFDALSESVKIGLARLAPTIGIVVSVVIIRAVMVVIGILLSGIPFAGSFLETIVLELVATYVTVLVVGEYRSLERT